MTKDDIIQFYSNQLTKFSDLLDQGIYSTEYKVPITPTLIGATRRRLNELKSARNILYLERLKQQQELGRDN